MTKTFSVTVGAFAAALVLFAVYASALSVYAQSRESRSRDEVEPAPTSAPTVTISISGGGGITSSTGGTADSGGNSGGTVSTGDELVEVYVVNVGPTNPTPPPQDDGQESLPTRSDRTR